MKVQVNMINVEDGDAILVMLDEGDKKALVMIDGGYKRFYPRVKRRLEEVLPHYGNRIDLLICTHYDNDHLGGTERILDDYHDRIDEIWIHRIEKELDDEISLIESKINEFRQNLIAESGRIIKDFRAFPDKGGLVLEGYEDLLRVVQNIKKYNLEAKTFQSTAGKKFAKFPQWQVMGPSADYYNANLPELKEEGLAEDIKANIDNSDKTLQPLSELLAEALIDPDRPEEYCKKLEKSSIARSVTPTNMVSIVNLLTVNGKKFLFTGDAGIESFEDHMSGWQADLKDLFFLDLPHHGSKNNTSKKMLDVFNPEILFVSGDGGSNRPSVFIENCANSRSALKHFEVTNRPVNTWYLSIDESGDYKRVLE